MGFRFGCFDKNSKVTRDELLARSPSFLEVSCSLMYEQPLMIAA